MSLLIPSVVFLTRFFKQHFVIEPDLTNHAEG